MLIASIFKELRLLSRDLHGVAVLFMMPILFMLIMSAALSNDNELTHKSDIVLLSDMENPFNVDFFQALQKENLQVHHANLSELNRYQNELQAGKFELVIANFNEKTTALSEDQPLQLWLNPSVDRGWLLGVKGVLQKHYTEQRIKHYLNNNHITLENNKRKQIKEIENKVNKELDRKFAQINDYLAKNLWQEVYLNRQGSEVAKPNSVQHSVPAWLIFGMFFIMIPLSNVMAMERHTNTITRLRMARASALSLIIAKLIPYFIINQFQFAGMVALGYFVLPRLNMPAFELVGDGFSYAVLSSTVSLAALGYGLLVSVVARTTEHAVVLGGGGIIIMAAIGGIMVPTYVMPEIMQTVAEFSPMGWALSGFQNLLLNQYDLSQIVNYLIKLSAFGILMIVLAAMLYQQQLKKQVRF
ncbi:ABC transporter permease [Conservatibacter flavescens]|uniref:ABC transporter permease n=1 Tax=Conservatibacter flavescens TaxID=28161 RepID=A0A2M8RZL5_9PAST|nr:ABC transporter permease [Conservatibacter flavescens]PJG84341.1 ABC transporter permease [Conservatibacter flavescens]